MRWARDRTFQAALLPAAMAVCLMQPLAVRAEQSFYDRARVVGVTPVSVRLEGVPLDAPCDASVHRAAARPYPPGITLARALRGDLERARTRAECSAVPARASGYLVRYEYEGRIYERRMPQDPGEWVEVRVRVRPR